MLKKIALCFIWLYQKAISPYLGQNCRYFPSCSFYAKEAIQKYGVCKGSFIALKRILRCHPFCQGGFDPVI